MNTSGNAVVSTAAKNITGFVQNNPTSGQAASVAVNGVTKAVLGTGGATTGQQLEVESGGKLVALASGTAVARAMQTGSAGNTISVEILKSNAVYA